MCLFWGGDYDTERTNPHCRRAAGGAGAEPCFLQPLFWLGKRVGFSFAVHAARVLCAHLFYCNGRDAQRDWVVALRRCPGASERLEPRDSGRLGGVLDVPVAGPVSCV